jgi:hypothetical protein
VEGEDVKWVNCTGCDDCNPKTYNSALVDPAFDGIPPGVDKRGAAEMADQIFESVIRICESVGFAAITDSERSDYARAPELAEEFRHIASGARICAKKIEDFQKKWKLDRNISMYGK